MSERPPGVDGGWFVGLEPGDEAGAAAAVEEGETETPRAWPRLAVESGYADSEAAYYVALREATIRAARSAVRERERADDRQVVHAVRTMDDLADVTNELAERLSEWAGALFDESGTGLGYARDVATRHPETPTEARVVGLARRIRDLADERDELQAFLERMVPLVAPNLASMAGPVLAARLIELAGDLESLAKMPSGTVQVLGAEDALFAHLRGNAPSPKHGAIYTHEYVHGTRPADRGSAARALAGKLAIGARIDHYAGDYRPEVEAELDERIAAIRARSAAGGANGGDGE